MRRRLARWRLAAALQPLLPAAGLLVRSQDLLLRWEGARVRLLPRREGAPAPQGVPTTRFFLLVGLDGPPSPRLVARLREWEPPGLGSLLSPALGAGPSVTVHVGGDCEQGCGFCREAGGRGRRDRPRALGDVLAELRVARRSFDRLLLRGDDALAHRRLPAIVSAACDMGYASVSVLCPGPRLAEDALAARLARAGLDVVEVALYGADPRTHDAVVGLPGAFARLCQGLAPLQRVGVQVIAHTALVAETLPALGEMAALAFASGWCLERLEGLVADEGGLARYRANAPDIGTIRDALARACPRLDAPVELRELPACAAPARCEALLWRAPDSRRAGRVPHVHVGPCAECRRRQECPGPSESYLAVHGTKGLRAIGG